jgi:hypothetical protein
MTRPTCETCLFFSGNKSYGTCRRHAPAVFAGANAGTITSWPSISPDDWCAEHSEWADYEYKVYNEAMQAAAGLEAQ